MAEDESLDSLSIKQLKLELSSRGLSTTAVEKGDLVKRLREAKSKGPSTKKATPEAAAKCQVDRVMRCHPENFYAVLDAPSKADAATLKKSYRRLVSACTTNDD